MKTIIFVIILLVLINIKTIHCSEDSSSLNKDKIIIDLIKFSLNNCEPNIYIFSKVYNDIKEIEIFYNNENFIKNDIKILTNESLLKEKFGEEINIYLTNTSDKENLKIYLIEPKTVSQNSNVTLQYYNQSTINIPEQIKLLELNSTICRNKIEGIILELNGLFFYNKNQIPSISIEGVRNDTLSHQCKAIESSNTTIKCILDKSFFNGCIEKILMKNVIGFSQGYKSLEDNICSGKPVIDKVFLHHDAVTRSFKATIIGHNFEGGVIGFLRLECKTPINQDDKIDLLDNEIDGYGNLFKSENSNLNNHIVIFNFPDEVSDVLEMNEISKDSKKLFNYLIIEQLYGSQYKFNSSKRELIEINWKQVTINNEDSKLLGLIAIPSFLFMMSIILATTFLFKTLYKKEKNNLNKKSDGANVPEENITTNNETFINSENIDSVSENNFEMKQL